MFDELSDYDFLELVKKECDKRIQDNGCIDVRDFYNGEYKGIIDFALVSIALACRDID